MEELIQPRPSHHAAEKCSADVSSAKERLCTMVAGGRDARGTLAGFSLIEMLVAILILSVAIIGIVALFPTGYSQIKSAGRLSAMNHLGQQKLDELRNLNFDDPDLTAGTHPTGGESFPERESYIDSDGTDIYQDYSIEWYVTDNVEGETDMKSVVVTVGHQLYYSDGTPADDEDVLHQQKIQFQTYITE